MLRSGRVEVYDATSAGNTSTGWPSPLGAMHSSGNAQRKAPSSWKARPSSNIRALDGGRSVWAVADIVAPFRIGPLSFGNRPMDQQEDANRVESFRNATKSSPKLGKRIFPFKLLIVRSKGSPHLRALP